MANQAGQDVTQDFIFGTLTTAEDRVNALVSNWRGLSSPVLTMGSDEWRIDISAGPEAPVTRVDICYTLDGSIPNPSTPGTQRLSMQEGEPTWNTLLWDYLRPFSASLPASAVPAGTILRYCVVGKLSGSTGATISSGDGRCYSQYHSPYAVPAWVHDAIIYHIFVDRFSPPAGTSFASHENLSGFYGGTLRGIIERLDYISGLGVNALWLSPIFRSPSHHGYDSTDFMEIEPRLGTKEDLKTLVEAAHARGIRVILDHIPNHISNEHPYFVSASSDAQSPYRDYFTFTRWPDKYKSFFNVRSLPQINNENLQARRYAIDAALYWLREANVDGFRLDYANGPSHDFWTDYYVAVKQARPDSIHFGEIVETPELMRSYEGRLDGALDFVFLQHVRSAFAFDLIDVAQFDQWLHRHEAYFHDRNFVLPTFLDNHDMNRFLWVTRGDKRRLKLAALLQFTLKAPPIIYYGTEGGLSQLRDVRQGSRGIAEESRLPMRWDALDADLLDFYKRLIAARHHILDKLSAPRQTLLADGLTGQYSYCYNGSDGKPSVIVVFNHSPQPQTISLNVGGQWTDLLTGNRFSADANLSISLGPYSGTLLSA